MSENNNKSPKYIKVCKDSGCVSANYSIYDKDKELLIIPYENNELSGSFELSKTDKNNQ